MKYEGLVKEIIKNVGGKKNVESVYHCMTRLRFKLKDTSLVDKKAIESINGVVSLVVSGGQYQIVIGSHVADVYKELVKVGDFENNIDNRKEEAPKGLFNKFVDVISGVFTPVLGMLTATGLIKGLVALGQVLKILDPTSGTYKILSVAGDCFFYFLPIFLGYTAMKKFNGTPFLGMGIGAALIHPTIGVMLKGTPLFSLFTGTAIESQVTTTFAGVPVILLNYASSVIPVIIACYFASKVENALNKIIPSAVKMFLVPCISLLIVIPFTFIVIGPIAIGLSKLLGAAAIGIYNLNSTIFGFLYGSLIQVCVMFGLHWGFVSICLNNMTTLGYDSITITGMAAAFGQGSVVLALMIKYWNNEKLRQVSLPAFISAMFGVTEPAIYGVNLPRKKAFIIGCIASGVGGAIIGYSNVKQYTFGTNGIFGFLQIIKPGSTELDWSVYGAIIACVVSFVIGLIMTLVLYKEKEDTFNAEVIGKSIVVSPLTGKIIDKSQINDPVFSNDTLGRSIVIEPSEGVVYSPFDGEVAAVFETGHAIALRNKQGAEILIHIGIDTVKLEGKYFEKHVKIGDMVKENAKLISFDIEGIKKEGYSVVTPVIVANTESFSSIEFIANKEVEVGENLIYLS